MTQSSTIPSDAAPLELPGYSLSTDSAHIDFAYVHGFLSQKSYWAQSITKQRLQRAIGNSLCFSAFHEGKQVAFARVITDFAVFAYLCDVFVDPGHRGKGVGKWLMRSIMAYPELEVRRWILGTRDAHGLYAKSGFTALKKPDIFMEKFDPEIYAREEGER